MPYIGEMAALIAAFLWGGTAILFSEAGKRVGAFSTNIIRISMAMVFLSLTFYFSKGLFYPVHATLPQMLWLGASGIIGLAIGDGALFICFVLLGPRLSTLLLSLAPPITAIIAWIFLNEKLSPIAIVGILLTIFGIFWVVNEKGATDEIKGSKMKGIFLGIIAALGQGIGIILSKNGLQGDLDALSATLLRMAPAMVLLWIVTFVFGKSGKIITAIQHKKAALATLGGAVVGPFLGIWLSIVAVKYTEAGVAATLLATVPIAILPMVYITHKHKPSLRALLGTVVAVIGIALIFLR
jgi:drug/metabolite transporter (DMT)-like permease